MLNMACKQGQRKTESIQSNEDQTVQHCDTLRRDLSDLLPSIIDGSGDSMGTFFQFCTTQSATFPIKHTTTRIFIRKTDILHSFCRSLFKNKIIDLINEKTLNVIVEKAITNYKYSVLFFNAIVNGMISDKQLLLAAKKNTQKFKQLLIISKGDSV
jgi:hypothetical protein